MHSLCSMACAVAEIEFESDSLFARGAMFRVAAHVLEIPPHCNTIKTRERHSCQRLFSRHRENRVATRTTYSLAKNGCFDSL